MSSEPPAISIKNLGKRFEIYEEPSQRLKQFLLPNIYRLFGKTPKTYYREFWALKDINLEIKRGQTVAVIGRNGSGKSTLLQMICGTLNPTTGTILTQGRIAALLELGSGFNPDFTGRDNVVMSATVLGLTRAEIKQRFDAIINFADIGQHIDQPVKTYSSGMMVRLAFSVVAHVDADILVIDEALAVGDVFFQQKCMRFLASFQERGGTILFVSHDVAAVTALCKTAVLLSRANGSNFKQGTTEEMCRSYLSELYAERSDLAKVPLAPPISLLSEAGSDACACRLVEGVSQETSLMQVSPFQHNAESFGAGGLKITNVEFRDVAGQAIDKIIGGDTVSLVICVVAYQKIEKPAFGFMLKDHLGQFLVAEGTDIAFRSLDLSISRGDKVEVEFLFSMPILIQGEYTLNIAAADGIGHDHIQHHWIHDALVIKSLKSRLVHGICGVQNMDQKVRIFSAIGTQ